AFHQLEGIQLFSSHHQVQDALSSDFPTITPQNIITTTPSNPFQASHNVETAQLVAQHLQQSLNNMVQHILPLDKPLHARWVDAYFPFTSPSWEMEILYNGKWMEICGCGLIQQNILNKANQTNKMGWAFGLGLERLAMVLFSIPDIRLFWSKDERFLN